MIVRLLPNTWPVYNLFCFQALVRRWLLDDPSNSTWAVNYLNFTRTPGKGVSSEKLWPGCAQCATNYVTELCPVRHWTMPSMPLNYAQCLAELCQVCNWTMPSAWLNHAKCVTELCPVRHWTMHCALVNYAQCIPYYALCLKWWPNSVDIMCACYYEIHRNQCSVIKYTILTNTPSLLDMKVYFSDWDFHG